MALLIVLRSASSARLRISRPSASFSTWPATSPSIEERLSASLARSSSSAFDRVERSWNSLFVWSSMMPLTFRRSSSTTFDSVERSWTSRLVWSAIRLFIFCRSSSMAFDSVERSWTSRLVWSAIRLFTFCRSASRAFESWLRSSATCSE
ncbi:hypothetical protein AJ88_05395 [Mesorhizobium amorphae CCBAU 01583]|nr:hypothetical protein AJ88_05395 [Mesorhizobium amorphae CCBAU 01583]